MGAMAAEEDRAKALFDACDADGDGRVTRADLEAALRKLAGRSEGSRAKFAACDKDGDGSLEFDEFREAVFGRRRAADANAPDGDVAVGAWGSEYFESHGLSAFFVRMAIAVDKERPEEPYTWMMQYLAKQRPQKREGDASNGSSHVTADTGGHTGPRIRVNISAVLRRTPRKLLDLILAEKGWEAVEVASDASSDIYFVWDPRSFMQRLGHPSSLGIEQVPQLPVNASINKLPGMAHLCDKVNMALALRLLQKLWPQKFKFWPKSWLLPAEIDPLKRWLTKHKSSTVIVKPADGSLGEGIFLAQSACDLDAKLLAKPNWGGGYSALAQKYVAEPLLIGGLKFDLRLYVVVTSTDPLTAYLCKEGLARFCTTKYEQPTQQNANQHYMHLTNFSVNKKSAGFVKATDPFDPETQASKRPLSTLLKQIEVQEAAQGRVFEEEKFFKACEEVVAVLLQSLAPVLNVTYSRVAREAKPKAKAKAKPKAKARKNVENSSDEEESDESDEEKDTFEPSCFQLLGVDVLIDEHLQPWLLEVNSRPSMDIDEPVRMEEAPPGKRRCVCRDMDGDEHVHLPSKVDIAVKTKALRGAMLLAMERPLPDGYVELNFAEHSPGGDMGLGYTLQVIARLYQVAGGGEKAFTTYGVRRALAQAIKDGLNPIDLDTAVARWRHQGYRQSGEVEKDTAEIGVLDFAGLLQEVAMAQPGVDEDAPLDALTALVENCDPDD